MASSTVKAMAQATLDRLDASVKDLIRDHVSKERCKYERRAASWYGRLFGFTVPSDEEIEAAHLARSVGVNSIFDPAAFYGMYGWRNRQVAEQLLKAVKYADRVQVSVEDLSYL